MKKVQASTGAYLAAAAMAGITLFVFYTLREIGPESTLRRFHQDLALGRKFDLAETLSTPVEEPASQVLLNTMARVYSAGSPEPQVARMERDSNKKRAFAVLLYRTGAGGLIPIRWVLVRQKAVWRIDAAATIQQTNLLIGS